MGYDVTFHPINEAEMRTWYFDRLKEINSENTVFAQELANNAKMQDFYIVKYLNILRAGVEALDKENESFDKTHGFYIAIIQGFFREYFYTRGSSFSFLIEEYPEFSKYTKTWQEILGIDDMTVNNKITENYSSGVYIPYKKLKQLYKDYSQNTDIQEKINTVFSEGRVYVLLKAITYALKHELGILEATEVTEPNPMDLNKTRSYSNLFNCDKDGAVLYSNTALKQVSDIVDTDKKTGDKDSSIKGFISNVFKNK